MPVAKAASHGLTSCSADTLEDYMGHSGTVGKCEHICAVVEHTWQLQATFCSNLKKKKYSPQDAFIQYTTDYDTLLQLVVKKQNKTVALMKVHEHLPC